MYKHLLVPTDGTELSNQTISSAVSFAKDAGARITFFYAAPDFLATEDGALMRSISPSAVAENITGDAHVILMKAEAAARAAKVDYKSLYRVSDKPHEAIVRTAEEQGCDLIFMASRGPKSIGGLLLGSETLKVLMHATVPVLVSSVMRNSTTPEMNASITTIQDEHRSLAAVLNALQHVHGKALEQDTLPDFKLLGQLVFYIREFPEKLHHPKENAYLFTRLRQRTDSVNEALAILEKEHADKDDFDALENALRRFEKEGKSAAPAFTTALENFTNGQWRHMSLEEQTILPAAREHLLAEDWVEIAEAFGKNGDPRFGAVPDTEFRNLFAQLARLTQTLVKA